MPIEIQKSCLVAPASDESDGPQLQANDNIVFECDACMHARAKAMDDTINGCRLMALLLLLPTSSFCMDLSLQTAFDEIRDRLFPPHFDSQKISRVCRKLAFRILSDSDKGQALTYKRQDLRCVYDDKVLPIIVVRQLGERYPHLRNQLKNTKTWGQLTALAERVSNNKRLLAAISELRDHIIDRDYGLPATQGLCEQDQTKLEESLNDFDSDHFSNSWELPLDKGDIVIVRAVFANNTKFAAYANGNLITLQPRFFLSDMSDNFSSSGIWPEQTLLGELHSGDWAAALMFHELTHTGSVLNTEDEPLDEREVQELKIAHRMDRPVQNLASLNWDVNIFDMPHDQKGYGHKNCMDLANLDKEFGTTRAEGNADSWALLALLFFLQIKYPQSDFGGDEGLTLRRNLIHHSSLFDCLLAPGESIKSDPCYDPAQDVWAQQHGDDVPKNVKELIEVLEGMYTEHEAKLKNTGPNTLSSSL